MGLFTRAKSVPTAPLTGLKVEVAKGDSLRFDFVGSVYDGEVSEGEVLGMLAAMAAGLRDAGHTVEVTLKRTEAERF